MKQKMELGKIPPHDIEAEQAVLGSMLTDDEAVMAAVERLKADCFYRKKDLRRKNIRHALRKIQMRYRIRKEG